MGQKPKLNCDGCGKKKKWNATSKRWICQPCKGKKLNEWRKNKSAETPKKGRAKKNTYHKWTTTLRDADGKKKGVCKECAAFAEFDLNRNICVECATFKRSIKNPVVRDAEWRKKRNKQNLIAKRKREQDPVYREKELATYRDNQLKKRYSIDNDIYNLMFCNQNGLCAICKQPETAMRNGYLLKMSVDHDHTTGAIRCLLCHKCNRGLGLLQDSTDLLKVAISYLEEHTKNPNRLINKIREQLKQESLNT